MKFPPVLEVTYNKEYSAPRRHFDPGGGVSAQMGFVASGFVSFAAWSVNMRRMNRTFEVTKTKKVMCMLRVRGQEKRRWPCNEKKKQIVAAY